MQLDSTENNGPIILSIDTSPSMIGNPMAFAKWLVIKVYEIAKKENRPLYVINFSVKCRTINMCGKEGDEDLMSFLNNCISGGSDGYEMIRKILYQLETETYKYADALIVSDFEFTSLEKSLCDRIKEAQKLGARFYGLFVNDRGNPSYKKVLDTIWYL